jgi:protein-L-isoaspartate(D-aspartate) O-methyltransferase
VSAPPRGPRFPVALDRLRGPDRPAAGTARMARPQRPLHDAARDAGRRSAPAGLGLDSDAVRARMVARLRAEGIDCVPVLQAFAQVPRHRFVDSALATQAYEDTSLPIGQGQTISKPSVVARMLALLFDGEQARRNGSLGRVLEIGTGCGYQTALLVRLARQVVSIERVQALHERARTRLAAPEFAAGAGSPRLLWRDGRDGHAPLGPYDTIVAAAGGDALPPAWIDQLAVGGRLVAPAVDAAGGQCLMIVDRGPAGLSWQRHEAVRFVPLKSGTE